MALTIIERNVQLDVYDHDLTPSKIKAIALDSKTRYVGAEIHNGGQTYDVGQNTGVTLTIIRPDKTGVQVTGETFQYTVGDGETVYGAYAELTQTALAISGTLKAQFMLTSGDQILRTEIFSINNGVALDAEVSEWAGEYQGYNLDELVQTVNESLAKVDAMEQDVSDLKEGLNYFPDSAEKANYTNLVSTSVDAIVTPDEIDKDFKKFANTFVNSSNKFTASNNYTTIVFRLPYKGFKISVICPKVFALNTMPTGTAGETIDIKDTITTSGSTSAEASYTLSYDRGTPILLVYYTQYLSPDYLYLKAESIKPYTEKRLILNPVQDEFSRNASKDTTRPTATANDTLDIKKYEGKLVVYTSGNLQSNSSYDTYAFRVPVESMTVYCSNGYRAVKTFFEPDKYASSTNNLKTALYQTDAGRVASFTATYGEWVVISINKNTYPNGLDLKTNLSCVFELPTLRLAYGQKGSFYKYVQATYSAGTQRYLYIYYASGTKIVQWVLQNTPSSNSNSDTWQIGAIYGFDFDGTEVSNGAYLVRNGEFELAIKEHGAEDFCGGVNHGDETTDSFVLFIDGKMISDPSVLADGKYHAFDRIDAFEIATVNRCNTPDEDILKHQKAWTFEDGKVRVHQSFKFLEEIQVDVMMVCMFAALRTYYHYGIRQGGVDIETMTSSNFEKKYTNGNDAWYMLYGNDTTAKIHCKTDNDGQFTDSASNIRPSMVWINNAEDANKLYFGYFGANYSSQPVTVAQDTIITAESEYDVAYTPMA